MPLFSIIVQRLLLPVLLLAVAGCTTPPAPPVYVDLDTAAPFDRLCAKLEKDGFDGRVLRRYYTHPDVAFEQDGTALFFHHSESKLNYDQFLTTASLNRAREYMQAQGRWLTAAQSAYTVDKEVITAILLVETRFGAYLGTRPTLNILSSMASLADPAMEAEFWQSIKETTTFTQEAYNKRVRDKSKWAYNELKAFLTYVEKEKIENPVSLQSSYAGAVGISQFMPSNILTLGRDGDNDGRVDLFTHPDAIFSVAAFLSHHGWKPGLDHQAAYKVLLNYNYSRPYAETVLKIRERLKTGPS